MEPQPMNRLSDEGSEMDAGIDAGLRVAFGSSTDPAVYGMGRTVLTALHEQFGVETHLFLRDEPEETSPMVDTRSSEVLSARASERYQILGEIGRGGIGSVLKGRDTDLGRDLAMKVLQSRFADNRQMIQRFIEEAQITGQLQHPGILPVYELGLRADQRPFFTMKLVKGRTLADLLADRGDAKSDRSRLISIFEHVCQTMAYAHARGVIHRDLKPANIMVGAYGEVQTVDWGLAKILKRAGSNENQDQSASDTVIETARSTRPGSESVAGAVMGTPAYMPPEQANGEIGSLDERSDVFALGAILFEILTGRLLYGGSASEALRRAQACDTAEAMEQLQDSDAEPELIDLARRCLACGTQDRPRSAQVVSTAVTAHLSSIEERARASQLAAAQASARAASERRSRRLTVALAGTIVLALLVGSAGFFVIEQERAERASLATQQVNDALNSASLLLGEAIATPVGDDGAWAALRTARDNLETLTLQSTDQSASQRVAAFLARLDRAERDHAMLTAAEEALVFGATHQDVESWLRMETQLRQAFLDYGIDLQNMSADEIVARLRESDQVPLFVDALEMWLGTKGQLGMYGVEGISIEETQRWVREVVQVADADPYRTAVRDVIYFGVFVQQPDVQRMIELAEAPEFETSLPRTKAWLASSFFFAQEPARGVDLFEQAAVLHPDDFMLSFDIAYHYAFAQRWEPAIRYYLRCLAIRPNSAGIWRSLGVALSNRGETSSALRAFERALEHQETHAPTYIDYGRALARADQLDDAVRAYQNAIDLQPDSAEAYCMLAQALDELGRQDEAAQAQARCDELGGPPPTPMELFEQFLEDTHQEPGDAEPDDDQ